MAPEKAVRFRPIGQPANGAGRSGVARQGSFTPPNCRLEPPVLPRGTARRFRSAGVTGLDYRANREAVRQRHRIGQPLRLGGGDGHHLFVEQGLHHIAEFGFVEIHAQLGAKRLQMAIERLERPASFSLAKALQRSG